MDKSRKPNEENEHFLTRTYSSKKQFINQYRKFYEGKTTAKELNLQILTELEATIAVSNIEKFKNLSNIICYIGNVENSATLQAFYDSTDNPIKNTNLVILACKHNAAEILQYIFDNTDILNNLSININGDAIAPTDKDESCHNAFYYAIRSGNLELIDTLINKWPNDYFVAQNTELDKILSQAYEELKLKNVPLSDEITIFIENKLINLRFFSTGQVKRVKISLANIKKRIDLVLENINLLYSYPKEVDERFLFIAKFVAQNIHILKRQLKRTYNCLPWEEIEFCLICFIDSKIVRQEINLIYNSVLPKERILRHLKNFATKLQNTELTEADINSNLPKLKRDNVIAAIIDDCPLMEELYDDFKQVKDIYSLEKISHFISLASIANPKKGEGQLVIARALQVTGEYLKNTLESPNISDNIKNVLLASVFHQSSEEVVQSFRDVLSHFYSLKSRVKFEESEGSSYFTMVQSDLDKIKNEIICVLENSKAKIIRIFLKQVTDSDDLNAAKKLVDSFIDILPDLKGKKFETAVNTKEINKLENLIDKLHVEIDDTTPFENSLFDEIRKKIFWEKKKLIEAQATYSKQMLSIANIADYVNLISRRKGSQSIKNAKDLLAQPSKNAEPFFGIPQLIAKISESVAARLCSRSKIFKINYLTSSINLTIQLQMCEIKGIEKLKNVFTSGKDENSSVATEENIKDINAKEALYKRLGTLRKLLNDNGMVIENNSNLIGKFHHYKKDKQFQLMVEMLVLDIMEILQHLRCLGNNFLFVDTCFPMLIGRSLRNHLAHGNSLINVLQFDEDVTVFSNALKLILEEGNLTTKMIGNSVLDDITQLNKHFKDNLSLLSNQQAMFEAARQGDIDKVKSYICKGADVKARAMNQWTVFHFAAAGGSLEATKFFLEDNSLSINARDNKHQTPLHIAASYGRENIVEFLLTEKLFSVDTTDDNNLTALHRSAENGHRGVVKILLRHKANAEARDCNKLTPLYVAARAGHQDVVQLLVFNKQITDNHQSETLFTPLHIASLNGHLEVVNILLKKKVNVNAKTINGFTPLLCAAQQGNSDVVKILLAHKADVKCQSVDGITAFLLAVALGNLEVVKTLMANKSKVDTIPSWRVLHEAAQSGYCDIFHFLLKKGYKVDTVCEDQQTALQIAAKYGHFDLVQLLIANKAKINKANNLGYTALHNAAEGGHNNIVELLLNKGANVNAKTFLSKATPLHGAAIGGHVAVATTLMQNKADINFKNADGSTPICIAAEHGYDDVVKALLRKGANIDEPDNNKWTPLHFAVYDNRLDVVNTLLSFGVNTNLKTKQNNTSIHLAAQCGFLEIVKVLLKKTGVNFRGENGTPLHGAALGGHLDVVQYILANGGNVNERDEDDWTPLRHAVQKGFTKIVKVLLANGADINAMDNLKRTPLMVAMLQGNVEIVKLLVSEGADPNCVVDNNNTPLHYAAEIGEAGVVEILLKNKARVNAKNNKGLTALFNAVRNGHNKVVKILLEHGAKTNLFSNKQISLLHIAVANGYSKITEMLLASDKSNVNTPDSDNKWTPLHAAVGCGKSEIVNTLLKNGANINVRDSSDRTPLFLAVQFSRANVLDDLIAGGGKVNDAVVSYEGSTRINMTPLHAAVGIGSKEIVQILLKNGATLNNRASEGVTPLFLAVQEGHEDIVKLLLNAGADVNISDDKGIAPLQTAAKKGYDSIVGLLLKFKARIDTRSKANLTALHAAAFCGHVKVMELLLTAVAKIDEVDYKGWTPLHHALQSGQEKAAEILILKGANVNFPDKYGTTPLHVSSDCGYEKIIELLLRNKANVNAVDNQCHTPLNLASGKGHLQAVHALLRDQNININAFDKDNTTALHVAVFGGYKRVTKALLTNGAYFDVKTLGGLTPLEIAIQQSRSQIATRLKLIENLFVSTSENNYSSVQKCITEKVLINCKSVRWETSLFTASQRGYTSIVCLLLENGAKVNSDNRNSSRMTPLHVAANIEIVKLLLKYGSIYNMQNDEGKTPLNLSKDQNTSNLLKLTDELFEGAMCGNDSVISKLRSAKPEELEAVTKARNNERQTLLSVAITNQHQHLALQITDLIQTPNGMQSSEQELVSLKKLLKAIESNSRSEVEKCIREGTGAINSKDTHGRTPLHYVVYNGKIDLLNTLLAAGADATHTTNKGNTVLHTAASKNYTEIVKVLLRHAECHNLDFINAQTTVGGTTSLHVAAMNGFYDIVQSLLKHGAAYNIQNSDGKTPFNLSKEQNTSNLLKLTEELFEGAMCGNDSVISKLTSAKPDELVAVTKARNKERQTLLSVAITNQHKDLALQITDLIQTPNGMQSSEQELVSLKKLLKAIESNSRSEVEICIREGTGAINSKDTHGRTPLHYVVYNGKIDLLNTLLAAGADATHTTNKGNTVLHTAASKNYTEIVKVLLRHAECHNLDFINAQTTVGGTTSLHVAAMNGFYDIVQSLLKHGAAYNIQNSDGKTPFNLSKEQNTSNLLKLTEELFEGAMCGNDSVISKLTSAKPDELVAVTKARNKERQTLLSVAITNQHKDLALQITDLIQTPNGMQSSEQELVSLKKLLKAIESNSRSEVEICIREGTGAINSKDTHGRTPLHYVVYNGKIDLLNTLLAAGADATHTTNKGNTVLHTAASKNYTEIVKVLLRHAECHNLDFINAQTTVGGTTSLHVAAMNGFYDIVQSLLKHGAAYNIQNSDGKTPFNLCKDQNTSNLLNLTEELFEGAKCGNDSVISKLRSARPDEIEVVTKARNKERQTLLAVAITNQHQHLALQITDLIQNPNQTKSPSEHNHSLDQLKKLKDAAEFHLKQSKYHLPMLYGQCYIADMLKRYPEKDKTLREGSHFLVNAFNLVKTYKKCMPGGKLADKNIEAINSKLVELQFHPKHIASGETYSTMSMYYFASTGQGSVYYNMLHSGLKEDIELFIEMVQRDINAPTILFLESVEQKLQSLQ